MRSIPQPFLDLSPDRAARDPAVVYHEGIYHCFYTAVEDRAGTYGLFVEVVQSPDLKTWSEPRRLTEAGLHFSSPGNVIRHEGQWILCLQSYPINPGESYGSEESRLWLMKSADLEKWSEPELLEAAGCRANWSGSKRQIDPYLVVYLEKFWCFYKTEGKLGLLVSDDLKTWQEACPEHPVLKPEQTPDGSTLENPCVIHDGESFVLFFSPCRKGRGIGIARSCDLIHWTDVHYLDFPELPWAAGGPTAAMVLDTRDKSGAWTLFFHGDGEGPHEAALGLAFSEDLENWRAKPELHHL